jgi:hypothetical protein
MHTVSAVLFSVAMAFARASAAPVPSPVPASIETSSTPVINVALSGGHVVVKTWADDRVLVASTSGVTWTYLSPEKTVGGIPKLISVDAQRITKRGKVGHLPAEVFQLPHLVGPHDLIRVVGEGNVTLTIPAGSPIVVIRVTHGSAVMRGYRGTFFVNDRIGSVRFKGVSGTGFAQTLHGTITALDSSFDRIRVRSGTGGILFERCVARQIVATSAFGDIAFDNGSFQPGLARFESKYGDVALGIANRGATVRAHSKGGAVRTTFASAGSAAANPPLHDDDVTVGNGAARITASSLSGSIYIYNGSIAEHPTYARAFPVIAKLLTPHPVARK